MYVEVSEAEFNRILERLQRQAEGRALKMPRVSDAIAQINEALTRLQELGWREAVYCPKDGSFFDAIEAGSSKPQTCCYLGTWPTGGWFTSDGHDLWPSHPILFRPKQN